MKNTKDIESLLFFGAFRFLQTGSTYVQLRLQENEIYLVFSASL